MLKFQVVTRFTLEEMNSFGILNYNIKKFIGNFNSRITTYST